MVDPRWSITRAGRNRPLTRVPARECSAYKRVPAVWSPLETTCVVMVELISRAWCRYVLPGTNDLSSIPTLATCVREISPQLRGCPMKVFSKRKEHDKITPRKGESYFHNAISLYLAVISHRWEESRSSQQMTRSGAILFIYVLFYFDMYVITL